MIVHNVAKSYGDQSVLNQVNITVRKGEIYGLLGPNGAGKSTLIKCILGMVKQDEGEIIIRNCKVDAKRSDYLKNIGYVPDSPFLYNYLTPREYLEFISDLQGVPAGQKHNNINYLLEQFSLLDRQDDMISTFSHGMRHKLSVAGAIVHKPHVLLLDEPLSSFDPPTTKFMKSFLKDYASEGNIIFMSTHLVDIAQHLCDRVGILLNGSILKEYEDLEGLRDFENLIIRDMEATNADIS
ncbi:ABC transporter ATP-binding protein [Metabacillus halosaccharovorans]|uniref:ABC transporter ATP-binding protein n=1 Tax=Metabacillus halosaccharovorans TaxID=930124 RepID=UPI001C1FB5A7|nr:ABC transporter ATP-binding protein [Metabacillus halosaccharovorans]